MQAGRAQTLPQLSIPDRPYSCPQPPALLCRCNQLEQGARENGEGHSGSSAESDAGQELEGLHQELGQVQERLFQASQELNELRHLHTEAQSEVSLHPVLA